MKSSDYWGIGFNRTKKLESKPKSFAIFTTISDEGVKEIFSIPKSGPHRCWKCILEPRLTGLALWGETRYRRISDALPWNRSAKILLFWYFFNRSTWSYRMCPFLFQIISFFILHSPNNVFRPETMCFWHCRALQVGVKIEIVKINIFRLKLWKRQKHVKKWILVHFLVRVFWSCVHEALKEEILNAQLFTSAFRQKSSFQSATRINLA